MPLISTHGLSKSFAAGDERLEVLKDINLTIDNGEFVAIMGPSGSGKSTLLSILGGIESPTTGQVRIEGTDLSQLDDDARTLLRRRRIGFIFQAFNLIPTLSAIENVALPMELDGMRIDEAKGRAREALAVVELLHRADHLPSRMSGGEQQRVAIARAIAIRPALLLADEPTGNLDSRQSQRITQMLKSLVRDHGQTIVMVTHDGTVAQSASRLILFRDGQVERDVFHSDWASNPAFVVTSDG